MKLNENKIHNSIIRMASYGLSNDVIANRLGITIGMVVSQKRLSGKGNSFLKRDFDLSESEIENIGIVNNVYIDFELFNLPSPCRLSFTERLQNELNQTI